MPYGFGGTTTGDAFRETKLIECLEGSSPPVSGERNEGEKEGGGGEIKTATHITCNILIRSVYDSPALSFHPALSVQ